MCDFDHRILTGELDLPINKIDEQFIINTVCNHKGTTYEDINVRSRNRDLNYARQLCMYFLIENKFSTSKAGAPFNRDHATAMHAVKTINNYYANDKQVYNDVNEIRFKLAY